MTIFNLSWRNIVSKPLSSGLTLILFATGLAIITLLMLMSHQLEEKYRQNRAGVDMVVGAKGSRLQVILSSIYHIDNPTGNIQVKEARFLLKDPRVEVFPIALGDNYKDRRIVGTDTSYIRLYEGELAEGEWWKEDLEVTIGAEVAKFTGLKLGDEFTGVHGIGNAEGHVHEEFKYKVVGIMKANGSVLDQLILTNIASVWKVHSDHGHDHGHDHGEHEHDEHEHGEHTHTHNGETHSHAHGDEKHSHEEGDAGHAHNHDHDHDTGHTHAEEEPKPRKRRPIRGIVPQDHYLLDHEDKEVTALLCRFKGSNAILLQGFIDNNTDMIAAMPEIESQKLFELIEPGVEYIRILAWLIIIISGFSVFISLVKSLQERRYEIALMRVLGGSPLQVFVMVVLEGVILSLLGWGLGIVLSHGMMEMMATSLEASYHYDFTGMIFLSEEFDILGIGLLIGLAASLLPAISAMGTNIAATLSKKN